MNVYLIQWDVDAFRHKPVWVDGWTLPEGQWRSSDQPTVSTGDGNSTDVGAVLMEKR